MHVYLDNAATTKLDEAVLEAMLPYMTTLFGNPSSIHSHGRAAKVAIEKARKHVAACLNASPSEIFFTSGGTEGNNMALRGSIEGLGIQHVITSPIEHASVRAPLAQLAQSGQIQLHLVAVDDQGHIQYDQLENLLKRLDRTLVSLMHANHEIGNLNDLTRIGLLCKAYNAIFHADAVQTIAHYTYDLQALPLHLMVGSAHKFHGPKGIGFVYINRALKIAPLIYGGMQERGMRSGTESIAHIVGLSKALEIAYRDRIQNRQHIQGLKERMIRHLQERIPGVCFNGDSADLAKSLYTILSVRLPPADKHELLLFNLDIQQIAASAGSACTSGSHIGSHVLAALNKDPLGTIRFSFSKYNTPAEIDYTVEKLAMLCQGPSSPAGL